MDTIARATLFGSGIGFCGGTVAYAGMPKHQSTGFIDLNLDIYIIPLASFAGGLAGFCLGAAKACVDTVLEKWHKKVDAPSPRM